MADAEVYSLDNPSTRNSTLTMDTQRYDPAKRSFSAYEEGGVSDDAASRSESPSGLHHISLIEALRSPLLPTARAAPEHPPFHSQRCDALNVPLRLSPVLPSSRHGLIEDHFPISDTLNKESLIKISLSSDGDFKSRQIPENHLPSIVAPSPRVPHTFRRPARPLFQENDGSERIFSRPASPMPMSPPLSPQSRPTSPLGWPARPLSPSDYRFNSLESDCLDSMSCPTSPVLRPSKLLPSPTSPTACQAMFATASRRLRALSSKPSMTHWISSVPSRPTSPTSRPTSPVLQVFNFDNWLPERDPTEGIDVIEIMVTKEISVRIEETV